MSIAERLRVKLKQEGEESPTTREIAMVEAVQDSLPGAIRKLVEQVLRDRKDVG